eukprot:176749_1
MATVVAKCTTALFKRAKLIINMGEHYYREEMKDIIDDYEGNIDWETVKQKLWGADPYDDITDQKHDAHTLISIIWVPWESSLHNMYEEYYKQNNLSQPISITSFSSVKVSTNMTDIKCLAAHCAAFKRITMILKAYHELIQTNQKARLLEIIQNKYPYDQQQLFNDFLHVRIMHIEIGNDKPKTEHFDIEKKICRYLEGKLDLKCDKMDNCPSIIRHYQTKNNKKNPGQLDTKDAVFQAECDKIHVYFLHPTVQSVETNTMNKHGPQKEDDEWWSYIDEKKDDEYVYRCLVQKMGVFRWQNPHMNRHISHCKPKWNNIKEEALNNEYQQLSEDNWNQTLRKAQLFHDCWTRNRIYTKYKGYYYDQVYGNKEEWNKGKLIEFKEIVTLKLYTDFDKLQFELKKCFRFDVDHQQISVAKDEYENRLKNFYHWRG